MHFSCLVITEQRPDDGTIDDLMWPWCLSNEERRDAKADYWEIGGRYAQMFSVDDLPVETTSWDFVGPGNQLAKRDVPFAHLAERAATTKAAVYDQAQAVLATRRFGFWKRRLKLPDLASLEKQHGIAAAHDIFRPIPLSARSGERSTRCFSLTTSLRSRDPARRCWLRRAGRPFSPMPSRAATAGMNAKNRS